MFTPPSLESIFLILCGAILLTGVLYWFWSHLQLTQKKVQLLENVVFELRGLLGTTPGPGPVPVKTENTQSSPYNDLEDDDWEDDGADATDIKEVSDGSTPLEDIVADVPLSGLGGGPSTLAPVELSGSLLPEGVSVNETAEALPSYEEVQRNREEAENGFRSLFVTPATVPSSSKSTTGGDALENMTLKDLRRLAEERGIKGASELRKKELLPILRQQTGFVERTLDLIITEPTAEQSTEVQVERVDE
jgi:hypothetical protein